MWAGTVKSVIVHDGFRGLYRGLGPTILGYLPTWAIYFSVYDFIKSSFGEAPLGISDQARNLKSDQIYPAAQVKGYQPVIREHPWSLHILSAMTAGAVSSTATNPLWVIKTRFMVRHPHLPLIQADAKVQRHNRGLRFGIGTHWTRL
jgi:solute carrier family 25 folate transporter 32